MSTDEQSLIASCQSGTLTDFDPLYRQYVKQIYAFIYRRTLVTQTAEDITSVTFMRALEKIHLYAPSKGPFVAWLYSIARNCIADHYRAAREVKNIDDVWDLSSSEDIEHGTHSKVAFEKLQAALHTLDKDKRDIVMLRLWEGLSYAEIAAVTGKSEGNCKVIFCRTIDTLRTQLPALTYLLLLLFPSVL
jgi:RNA polymerase sigma-70 factor (ECF subfamily)